MTGQELYTYILHSNIINFTIMISILVCIFKKAKLGNMIDSIENDIKKNLATSAEAVQNALSEYKKAKREARELEAKKEEIIKNAKEVAESLNKSNEEYIEKKQKDLDLSAEKAKESYYTRKIQKTTYEIQEIIYNLSMEALKDTNNDELQKNLILNSLDEFDRIEGAL